MSAQQRPYRPSIFNLIVLFSAAAASLATLVPDHSSGHSRQSLEWPRGDTGQRLQVKIEPVGDRLDAFDYGGSFHLELGMDHIDQRLIETVRWALAIDTADGGTFTRDGVFTELGGDVHHEDNGDIYGDLSVRIGMLCDQETSADDCIPCSVDTGCTLTIDIERCHTFGDELTQVEVRLTRDDGSIFENRCERDEDTQPCHDLEDWISIENEPLDMSLCPDDSESERDGEDGDDSGG